MQMFATLNYIQTQHPYGRIAGQPDQSPAANAREDGLRMEAGDNVHDGRGSRLLSTDRSPVATTIKQEPMTPSADAADTFNNALRQLARDLVIQEQKAEMLINSLPGIGSTERDQKRRMQELEAELKQVSIQRTNGESEKARMIRDLDRLILSIRRPG